MRRTNEINQVLSSLLALDRYNNYDKKPSDYLVMGDSPPLFVILPILLVVKIMFWVAVCYRCSNRSRISRTTIIQRTVTRGPVDNGITGIENPGYMQQPLAYTDATRPNSTQAPVPSSYDQITKGPYYAEQYDQDTPRY